MREWLKSIGQACAGVGVLLTSIGYSWSLRRIARAQSGELVGGLIRIATEISSNNRTTILLLDEPHRLVDARHEPLKTAAWDQNLVRISQLLRDYRLLQLMAIYYDSVRSINDAIRYTTRDRERIEELRALAAECGQAGGYTEFQIRRYIADITGSATGK